MRRLAGRRSPVRYLEGRISIATQLFPCRHSFTDDIETRGKYFNHEEAFIIVVLVPVLVMSGPTSRILSNYALPMLHRLTKPLSHVWCMSGGV